MPKQRPIEDRIADHEATLALLKQQQRVVRELNKLQEMKKTRPAKRRRRSSTSS